MDNLGGFHRATSTTNLQAQRFFDQGLACLYSFHYSTAKRSFQRAIELDPDCAMNYWGLAFSDGPYINHPEVDEATSKETLAALDKADSAIHATPLEREIIAAQRLRYAIPAPKDRSQLSANYSNAMRQIWNNNKTDADVGAMFAEALIDERPWHQWSLTGQPMPGTLEAVGVLEDCLKINPKHPMALHMYIHAVEASMHPERALKAADILEGLLPQVGHMQHMPCHIYARIGQWDKAIDANLKALKNVFDYAASRGVSITSRPRVDHYDAALAYAAGMKGRSKLAISSLNTQGFSREWMAKNGKEYDGDLAMPVTVLQQFGHWDEILATEPFPSNLPISQTMLLGAQTVAYSAREQLDQAKRCYQNFVESEARVPADATDDLNLYRDILDVEKHLCLGEILIRQKTTVNAGLSELSLAVSLEDRLNYSEPPSWLMPTRHALGAALLLLGKVKDAEPVFREQLRRTPNDGWALMGLSKSLRGQNKIVEANKYAALFKREWKNADVTISTSCMCLEPMSKK